MARWATVDEAAKYLRVHPVTLRKLISLQDGVGALFKKEPRLLVDLDEVDDHVKNGYNYV